MRFISIFTTLVLLLTACSNSSPKLPIQNIQTTAAGAESERNVSNLCELFDNPYPYHQKVVRLTTSLYSSLRMTLIGDEKCVPRHPLIDVDFSAELKASVCKKANAEQEKLCAIVSKSKDDTNDESYEVLIADLVGYFEYYESMEGFNSNGLRFRFRIDKIYNIEKITTSKIQKIVP